MSRNTKRFPIKDDDFKKASGTVRRPNTPYCVEVAIKPQGVAMRDSKNRKAGTLFFNNGEWAIFVKGIQDGEFDPIGGVEANMPK
ncbi:MAG: DUF397 domain-containing protein [bacterium]|nr:DUF397 domain-containing protein [bacterium]